MGSTYNDNDQYNSYIKITDICEPVSKFWLLNKKKNAEPMSR